MLTASNTLLADLQQGANGYVLQVDVTGFSSFYFGGGNISLPVQQLTFTGALQNNATTLLKWKTSSEINTAYFILERSSNGRDFYQIANLAASGNTSTETSYSFNDIDVANLQSADIYYRLKMVDISGAYKYSNIINITLPVAGGAITISPNPAFNDLKVKISSPVADNVVWQVIDNTGRVLMSDGVTLLKGNNEILIHLNKLAAGSYYLKVTGTNIDSKSKFQKL
jgi:hypothetical protein